LSADLSKKMGREDNQRIWLNFDKYAQISDFKELYKKVVPEIKKFEDRLQGFAADQFKMEQMIRRFDEVVSEKASRHDVQGIELKLKENPFSK